MNLGLYGFGPAKKRKWIAIDIGVTFPDAYWPGVDLVLPDIRFLESEVDNLEAIVITHAHEDHYGALLALWDRLQVPVYCTLFTAGMIEAKRLSERDAPEIPVTVFQAGETFSVGPFSIEAVHVTHSIPEPVSLAITSPLGTALHTADWKIDPAPAIGNPIDENSFRRIGDTGVLALVCDSTNAIRVGESPSEMEVSQGLQEVIEASPGRVFVTTFSSNVGRIKSIALAAEAAGRRVLILGRSLKRVIDVSRELNYLDGVAPFLDEAEFASVPREEIVVILTGSQGETRAALAKLSRDEMRNVHFTPGDRVVYSSRTIPGNEKLILDTQNRLIDMGVEIVTDNDALVHVSGHPRRSELKKMYDWVKPTIAVPVHGEAAHLSAHASLAADLGVPDVAPIRNGNMLRLAPGSAEIIADVPVGRIYKDGNFIGDEDEMGIPRRRSLSYVGHVAMALVVDRKGELVSEPDMECNGLPETFDDEDFEDFLFDAAIGAFESIPHKRRKDPELIRDAVTRAIRATARNLWGKKPVTTVFVSMV
ncbi:MAG: ribonuclease J [Pseudomonadota bacterium]